MIEAKAKNSRSAAPRSATALLLAFVLNVALIPCAAAFEVVADEGHDCCPPELRLEATDCCEVNDGSLQSRSATYEFDESETVSSATGYAVLELVPSARISPAADPPDPPDVSPDLSALFCVYLK